MQSKKLAGAKPSASSRRYLDIAEVKEDVVVMRDGTLRAVLLVSSINFALKSEDEQNAIIAQYVSFLNTLEFPLQIVIQSRRLNIDEYLNRLQQTEREQINELLRVQIADYREFIKELVTLGQIMQKQFFVVVPYNPLSDKRKGFFQRLNEVFSPALSVTLAETRFRKRREDLLSRAESVRANLSSMGLQTAMLDTQSLIELYYRVYNPELIDTQKMGNVQDLRVAENPSAA